MRRYWPWLRLAAALAVLTALGWKLGTDAFVAGLRAINGWSVAGAILVGLLTTVLSSWRWVLIARQLGQPVDFRTAVTDYYRSQLLNAVLPAGVLGDVLRAVRRGVRSVVLERVAGQVVLVSLAVATLFPYALLVLALLCGFKRLRGIVALSLGATVGYVGLFLIAVRTAGAAVPFSRLIPVAVLALLVMAIPVNLAGFGPREVYLATAFGAAGLGPAQGVTTGVVYGVLAMIAALPGAFTFLHRSHDEHSRVLQPALSTP